MLSLRFLVLFIHIVAVIVALGGSLFSTFALAPVLAEELEPPARIRVARRIVRRLGAIVLTSLAVLVVTGILNVLFIGGVSILLAIKLILVVVVIGLALYQYGSLGVQIWRLSAAGPSPEVADLQARFRRVGLTVGSIVLLIIYLSIGLTRGPARSSRRFAEGHGCHETKSRDELPDGWDGSPLSRFALGVVFTLSYGTGAHIVVRYLESVVRRVVECQRVRNPRMRRSCDRHVDRNSHRRATGAWRLAEKSLDGAAVIVGGLVAADGWAGQRGSRALQIHQRRIRHRIADRPLRLRHRNVLDKLLTACVYSIKIAAFALPVGMILFGVAIAIFMTTEPAGERLTQLPNESRRPHAKSPASRTPSAADRSSRAPAQSLRRQAWCAFGPHLLTRRRCRRASSKSSGPTATTIELNINGKPATLEIEPRVTLLRALREHLGLTGTKLVCDRGACGACTVHLDGKPVTSCMVLAIDARGHQVTTIEGLGTPANMHPVQAAFVEEDAQQCGFCTPGMVMSVAAALERNPAATTDEIKHATAGNTCRCGTYPHVFAAALKAVKPRTREPRTSDVATGHAQTRLSGQHARRHGRYSGRRTDAVAMGRTPVGRRQADAARRWTAESDGRRALHLRHRIARDALRRDPAQSVAARTHSQYRSVGGAASRGRARGACARRSRNPFRRTGSRSRRRDQFRYRRRRAQVDQGRLRNAAVRGRYGDAAKDSAPRVFGSGSNVGRTQALERRRRAEGTRELRRTRSRRPTRPPVQTHVCLETHGAVASFNAAGDQLTVWCSTQGVFSVRDDLAVYFSLPPDSVRVICEYLGGGFGSKFGATPEIIVAARLAKATGVPVKVMLPRADEHRSTGNRPNSEQKVRIGVDRDGKLTAIDLVQRGSGGIGGGAGSAGPFGSVYRCANIRTQETDIYTNAGPSSPMRAPGWPQGCFALELAMDEMARKAGIDRLEFRRRNSDNPVRAAEYEIGARAFGWAEKNEAAKSERPDQARRRRRVGRVACGRSVGPGGAGDRASRRQRRGARRHAGYRHRHAHGARDRRGGGTRAAGQSREVGNRRHAISFFGAERRQSERSVELARRAAGRGASQGQAVSDRRADSRRRAGRPRGGRRNDSRAHQSFARDFI